MIARLHYKCLESGAFRVPKLDTGGVQLEAAELTLILEGIELARDAGFKGECYAYAS